MLSPRSAQPGVRQLPHGKAPTVGRSAAGSFGEYFAKAEELLANFSAATRLPVRLVAADTGFEMPPAMNHVCQRARELSDTAVECLRFHKCLHDAGNGTAALSRAICRHGFLSGAMKIESAGRVLAYVEVGPVAVTNESMCDPALSLIEHFVSQLREQVAAVLQTTQPAFPACVLKALRHIKANLHQPVTLADSARAAALSPDRFSRVFRQHIGKSFAAYVAGLRVESACQMLKDCPHARISDIAMHCGFESIPYFNRLFVKHTGLTPGRFRARDGAP